MTDTLEEKRIMANIDRSFRNISMEEPNKEDCVGVITCLGSGWCDHCGRFYTFSLIRVGNLRTGKVYFQFCETCESKE